MSISNKCGEPRFYVIDSDLFNDTVYAYGEQVDHKTGDFEKCEVCGSPVSGRRWLPPLTAKLSKTSYGDFVFGTFATFLASEHFKQEYEESELKGIKEFEAVEVVKVSRMRPTSPKPPRYYNVLVERSKARVDEVKSQFVREDDDGEATCDYCGVGGLISSYKGVYIEPCTWDGLDIFIPIGLSGTIVTSQRFYDFIKDNGFTNMNLVPAEEYVASWARHK